MAASYHRSSGFVVLLALLLLLPAGASAAKVKVEVTRHDDTFEVRAEAEIDADVVAAWSVLTDYERLPRFIPGLQESTVVSRTGSRVLVDQRGETSLLFLTFPMHARLEIDEHPYDNVVSNAIDGNFKDLSGEYRLEDLGAGMRLHFKVRFTPDFSFPPLLGTLIVRNAAQKRFRAMVLEIEKTRRPAVTPPVK